MRIPTIHGRKRARIEIIPLIDIIFFLLATFMMVSMSMVKNTGISVKLPSAATSTSQDRKLTATISITKDSEIYLNKEKVSLDVLKVKLKSMKQSDEALTVFINGDEEASFGKAVSILDEVRLLGITKVSIQTKGKS